MYAKIVVLLGLIAATQAGGLYGSTAIGYAGDLGSSYYGVSPYSYASPIVKTIAPVYIPAISTVSQYSIHQAPVLKSYAPIAYTSYISPYTSHAYTPIGYSNYGAYIGGHSGYGSKYAW